MQAALLPSAVNFNSIRQLSSSLVSDLDPSNGTQQEDKLLTEVPHEAHTAVASSTSTTGFRPIAGRDDSAAGTDLCGCTVGRRKHPRRLRHEIGYARPSRLLPRKHFFYFYRTDTIKGLSGDELPKSPEVDIFGDFILGSYVTKKKILGANYAFTVALPILNTQLALPSLDVGSQTWGLSDIYIKPLELGWHFKRADVIAGYAFMAPTGRYTADANDNTDLGMWSNEFSAGTTFYFDQGKKWHAAGVGFYEIHASKQDLDSKNGDIFTLEGGAGRAFLQGYANAGLAYAGSGR